MDMAQLYSFQKVAEKEHLTKAAEELSISQPALSASLSRLEHELGVALFDRVGRRLSLNECGRIFQRYADRILQEVADAQAELSAYIAAENDELTICQAVKAEADYFLAFFKQTHPQVFLKKIEIGYEDVPRALASKDCHFVASACLAPEELDCGYVITGVEHMVVALSSEHPLAKRPFLRLDDIKQERFLSLPATSAYQAIINQLCADNGFSPHYICECYRCQLVSYLTQQMGIAITTSSTKNRVCGDLVAQMPITYVPIKEDFPPIYNVLLWNKTRKQNKAAQDFLAFVKKQDDLCVSCPSDSMDCR